MDKDKIEALSGDASDPYSFDGDGNANGDVVTQRRFYQWGDDCVIAIGELNQQNQWDDEAFDAKCEQLVSALATPAPDSEKPSSGCTGEGAASSEIAAGSIDSEKLREALTQCRDQFRFYEREHLAAGKTEKAATNGKFADLADAALGASA